MHKLTVLVIAALLATAFSGVDASEKTHRRHATSSPQKTRPAQPVENPATRLPVPVDTFRAGRVGRARARRGVHPTPVRGLLQSYAT